jgi:hypothetical protein
VIDPNRYELLTAIPRLPAAAGASLSPRKRGSIGPQWVRFGELAAGSVEARAQVTAKLKREREKTFFYDAQSGRKVTPHGGSVYYNSYRRKWIAIFVEAGGESSYLGEVWYAEADTPVGPWAYARKVVTHNKYSFYNPKHHPYFDKDGGRIIFFEGTYSFTFSGPAENATPRYDYNQIMYGLDLDDPRLVLPAPIYQIRDEKGQRDYLLRDAVEREGKWDSVESTPFYAVEPNRGDSALVPVYTQKTGAGNKLTADRPNQSTEPLFCALASSDSARDNSCVASLYEYHHADSGQYLYCTDPALREKGWIRAGVPLCRVWKSPPGPLLLDDKAKPAAAN